MAVVGLVVRVPPKMMARVRSSVWTRGKSDPIDALAVARAALREPDLPVARLDGPSREVKLLVDYRESLIRERTGLVCRLRWRLHELEPGYDPPASSLNRAKTLAAIDTVLEPHSGVVTDLARRELARIGEITGEVNELERDITARITEIAPSLLELVGCGALTAAKLVAEAADITRFKSRDAYAMFAGESPWGSWRLLALETRMESWVNKERRGSRRRGGTRRRRRPRRCGWSGSCVLRRGSVMGR